MAGVLWHATFVFNDPNGSIDAILPVGWQDASSNGTFLNGSKVPRGSSKILLRDGDRVSLVLSVAPLGEQSFIFR